MSAWVLVAAMFAVYAFVAGWALGNARQRRQEVWRFTESEAAIIRAEGQQLYGNPFAREVRPGIRKVFR